ncbi:MAG: cysteine--tRNA ligase [archaeon]
MTLKLYNTLGRKKQAFKPIKKGEVGIYSCGLTVYNYGHIGNYRAFVASDILTRYLKYLDYKVKKIVNITDVDDKTIKGSIKEGKKLKDYTKIYEDAFFEDEKAMNIEPASVYPRATEHIKEMVSLIKDLLKKEIAYKSDDGIYFNVKKFKDYGKLAGIKVDKLKAGGSERVSKDEYDKENVSDFALWKFYDKEDGDVFWDVDIGKGRPGWHIECSAMSSKYLGQPFDIHTGGVDLIFPHHENEIAQSEGAKCKKFVDYWVHNEWMMVNGKKMSKSLGNYFTVRDIIEKGYTPLALRYFFLTGHYRSQLNFTLDNLKNSQNSLERLKRIISKIKDDKKTNEKYLKKFEKAMDEDLDTVNALQVLWELVRDSKAEGKIQSIKKIDSVLGLDLLKKEKVSVPDEVMKLVKEREKARKDKDWEKADQLRDKIKSKGFQVNDTGDGSKVEKI